MSGGLVAAPAAAAAPVVSSATAPASLTIGGIGSGLLPVGGVGLLVLFGVAGAALVASRGRHDV